MRIGLVTPGFSASESDWCIPALLDLVRALGREHEVYVLALRYPHDGRRYHVHGATVDPLGGAGSRGLARVALLARAARVLGGEARARRLDLLHALWAHEPGWVVTRVAHRLGLPAVVSILGGELAALPDIGYGGQTSWMNRRLIAAALAGADAVTIGSATLEPLTAGRVDPARLTVAPLGVDADRFRPRPDPGDPRLAGHPALLAVGSLTPVKGQDLLLQAFARVRDRLPDAHLHVVGSGASDAALAAQTRQAGIESRVTWHGAVAHDRLAGYYRSADLCVLSSRFESQAMVVLEAAACGRRTVGTDVGLVAEIGGRAAAARSGDPAALAELLVAEGGAACTAPAPVDRERVVATFGLAATVARLTALYRQVARRGSAPAAREADAVRSGGRRTS